MEKHGLQSLSENRGSLAIGFISFSNCACVAGPTVLFQVMCRGEESGRRFYACSACRDRKDCSFFQWENEKVKELE